MGSTAGGALRPRFPVDSANTAHMNERKPDGNTPNQTAPLQYPLNEEQIKRISDALVERQAVAPCPRCGNESFSVVPGLFTFILQRPGGGIALGGPSAPSAATSCNRCGFLSAHFIGVLGFLGPSGEVTL
jgi:ribosomal protein L37E